MILTPLCREEHFLARINMLQNGYLLDTDTTVQMITAEGEPLSVTSYLEPVQSGSGDTYPPGGGKNKFPGWIEGLGLIPETGAEYPVDTAVYTSGATDFIPVTPSTTYFFVGLNELKSHLTIYYDADKSYIGRTPAYNRNWSCPQTPANCYYVRLSHGGTTADTGALPTKVVFAPENIAYEPYANIRPITGQDVVSLSVNNVLHTLHLSETVYGGTLNWATGEGKSLWAHITFDGTEAWIRRETTTYYTFGLMGTDFPSIETAGTLLCSHYPESGATTWADMGDVEIKANVEFLNIRDDRFASVEEWKSFLVAQYAAGTPVEVCYKLPEPVIFSIDAPPIIAQNNSTTILAMGENHTIDVGYAGIWMSLNRTSEVEINTSAVEVLVPISRKEIFLNDILAGRESPTLEPLSREEHFLAALLTGVCDLEPIARLEHFIKSCVDGVSPDIEPISRKELFWAKIGGWV